MIGLRCVSVWSAVMSGIRAFFLSFFRRCALNVVVFNQPHVSGPVQRCRDEGCFIYFYGLFCVLLTGEDLWPSVPRVSGSAGFNNKQNVSWKAFEMRLNVTVFQFLLAATVKHFWSVSLCQLDFEIVGSTVCCLSLKEHLSHPAGVLVKGTQTYICIWKSSSFRFIQIFSCEFNPYHQVAYCLSSILLMLFYFQTLICVIALYNKIQDINIS